MLGENRKLSDTRNKMIFEEETRENVWMQYYLSIENDSCKMERNRNDRLIRIGSEEETGSWMNTFIDSSVERKTSAENQIVIRSSK